MMNWDDKGKRMISEENGKTWEQIAMCKWLKNEIEGNGQSINTIIIRDKVYN